MSNSQTNNTKQAAWIAVGGLFSFGFGIVSSMILSRYFDKGDYGTYKQVLYIYNSLLTLFTLGLPKAFSYFLPRSPLDEAKSLINKITKLFFFLGGILSLFFLLGADFIASFFKNPDLTLALKVFSPVPFLMMPTMGLEGILATYRQTKFMALYTIITRVIMLLCVAVPVLLFGNNYIEAIVGFVIGSLISFVVALYFKYRPVRYELSNPTEVSYKEIFQFVLPLFIASIWGSLIAFTDQFFISRYFGNEIFADFSNGAMELPFVGMVIGACSAVLTPVFTKQVYQNADFDKEIFPIWHSAFAKSAMLIYPIVIFCLFDSSLIMQVMYGDIYVGSGDFFRIKLCTYFVKIISFYSILVALGATKFYEYTFMYVFFAMALIEFLVVKLFPNPLLVTGVHVVFTVFYSLIFIRYIAIKFKVPFMRLFPWKAINTIFIGSAMSIIIIMSLKHFLYSSVNSFFELVLDLSLFGILYLIFSYLLKLDYLNLIKPLLKK